MSKSKDKADASQPGASAIEQLTVAETPATKQVAVVDVLAQDENAGKPGSYVFDPETGKRSEAA